MAELHEHDASAAARTSGPAAAGRSPAPRVTSAGPRRTRRRPVAAPAPGAEHTLAARAAEVAAILAAGALPASWAGPGFARDVDLVRRQLGPLHDRRMLVASFERESSRLVALRRLASDPSAPPLAIDPTEAAYGIRWLELAADGAAVPPWADVADGQGRAAG